MGAETIKVVKLLTENGSIEWKDKYIIEHQNEPVDALLKILNKIDWDEISGANVYGRFSRQIRLPRVPVKQSQANGYRFLYRNNGPATIISIGSHGFSILELKDSGMDVFRENSRCSQGTGNFLKQLVQRFNYSIEEASEICENIENPSSLSGRCPVILKTDMTHLANKGEKQSQILAGLYDAVCSNVQVLIKPGVSPKKTILIGGVSQSKRIQNNFSAFLHNKGMVLQPYNIDNAIFLESLGAALNAIENPVKPPPLSEIFSPPEKVVLDEVPALRNNLPKIKRMKKVQILVPDNINAELILGFDMGSTGSKTVAINCENNAVVWEGYINTAGNPVNAAQILMKQFINSEAGKYKVIALGVTGSGREIVGSLMSNCYGAEHTFVLNEIAAHAQGAIHFDPRVDTISEIGGQDAKYIRLSEGKIIDAAMNEACSAGTGSFIEEQGKKFQGIENIIQLGEEAIKADFGVSLGQHCSVFMAEIIDEAVASGIENPSIIAGIYDSIIQNYLNRVKGSRTVGQVIFCQGMPFSSDALASAVVAQTGSEVIIPPNPGTVGALGIALLAKEECKDLNLKAVNPHLFLTAKIKNKDTFNCNSNKGCGGNGNKCRIDRIETIVADKEQKFTWGGGCSLWDKGTRTAKLPDLSPDPFKEREELIKQLIYESKQINSNKQKIALTDEFVLKGLFPYFITFFKSLNFEVKTFTDANHSDLKKGIEKANIPFCAPMQLYHGINQKIIENSNDLIFLPMIKSIPRVGTVPNSCTCPIVQGSSDILRWDFGKELWPRILSPTIEMGQKNLESPEFLTSMQKTAEALGINNNTWEKAHQEALNVQYKFDKQSKELGNKALDFCEKNSIIPIIVHGRPYTIYNKVLNSNVPAILREQGAIAIPIDCYEVDDHVPMFEDMYWGYGQQNLRAAHQTRRKDNVYSIWCSNYSCGPDSSIIHFFSYIMQGKPYAIIETDGHSGDAGTKTRIEAFLHCVKEDLKKKNTNLKNDFKKHQLTKFDVNTIKRENRILLIPSMGPGANIIASSMRGVKIKAEALKIPTRETLHYGRRHTSGKECVPLTITLGAIIERLKNEKDPNQKFTSLIPTTEGPCRFGVYNHLHKITMEKIGWKDRINVWSPNDDNYFNELPKGFSTLILLGFLTSDVLLSMLYDVRPIENKPGESQKLYNKYDKKLNVLLETVGQQKKLSFSKSLFQIINGQYYGCIELIKEAAEEFKKLKTEKEIPWISMVGEIYVRCDPFANDFIIEKFEKRGIGVRFAPFMEWIEYTDYYNIVERRVEGFSVKVSNFFQSRMIENIYAQAAKVLGWHKRTTIKDTIHASTKYIRRELNGEAVLTIGGPLHEWREGLICGVINVGPLECMPSKIAESQFSHIAEQEGLLSLTISYNGDPVDAQIIDNFAFEVKSHYKKMNQEKELKQKQVI